MNKCFIRFDAGKSIGLGHWYRCIALYHRLGQKGIEAIALIQEPQKEFKQELARQSVNYLPLQHTQNALEMISLQKKYNIKYLILDLMNLEITFVKTLNEHFSTFAIGGSGKGLDWVCFRIEGMLPRAGYADNFQGKELYIGPEFIIIRDLFITQKNFCVRNTIKKILITLGGDANAYGHRIAYFLHQLFPEMDITVIVGKFATKIDSIDKIHVYQDIENLVPFFLNSDIAVCSGGMTMFELCYIGTPFIILPQVALQEEIAISFKNKGIAEYISLQTQFNENNLSADLFEKISSLKTKTHRKEFSMRIKKIIDGRGLERISTTIKNKILEHS
jgi:UDP-2,4-diacetamido-2,4,6-trideoxy-beta-L-altropyranose hydrolase